MTAEDFPAFYTAVHGYPPFDWQRRLMVRVAADRWPATIALPTSSGKTSTIDIAVFHLALEAGRKATERNAAMRTFFVIDRRVVVDEAGEHARKIAVALRKRKDPILKEVADQLLRYGGESPLEVSTMRGGMYRDNSWADEPNQPLICVSTVDQAGSRLLFRGYQVGESSRPVHAGLIGNDCLMLMDEAHLSTAFRDTIASLSNRYLQWADCPPAKTLRLVEMSATIAGPSTFTLDRGSIDQDAELARRIDASKVTELREPKKNFEDEVVSAAKELATGAGISVVGVVVNTVGSARSIFEDLRRAKGVEAVLLIGRNRPFCAETIWNKYKQRIAAKKDRPAEPLLYVVATQTVEVGANIDFDTLVTEAAPLDSLRQRFGRLNRLGRQRVSKAVIVSRTKGDVVYGEATERTWRFLKEHEPVDFGVNSMNTLLDGMDLQAMGVNSPAHRGPLVFPAHLESWVQTNPTPAPDPEVAPFLHGDQALEAADVQVVWREDLSGAVEDSWKETVELAPPLATESLPMPIAAIKSWLKGQKYEIADVEGIAAGEAVEAKETKRNPGRAVLVWRGVGKSKVGFAKDIRPGDTIIVPTKYSGADEFGWNPQFEQTADIGDDANTEQAKRGLRKPRVRVSLLRDVNPVELDGLLRQLLAADDAVAAREARSAVAEKLGEAFAFAGPLQVDSNRKLITWPFQKRKDTDDAAIRVPSEETDEDDGSSFIGDWRSLASHTEGVVKQAHRYAKGCGLEAHFVEDIVLAAKLHDVGKCDERFQSWLYGKPFGGKEYLAKSGAQRPRSDDEKIRKRARYPDGARHEAGSVMAALASGLLERAHDADLVLHLIGAHHGYARPFFPTWTEDPSYRTVVDSGGVSAEITSGLELSRIDSGWVDRFWKLNRKYGYWGLAYLESILRRADCMQSRYEERRESN